jgi:anti-sigma regulatory factor (Ser/Thr protein kinase)
MSVIIDSVKDCKLLHSSATQGESTIILLRSRLIAIANRLGISDLKRENMLLVAAELASNNIKHAGGRGMIQIWQQPGSVIDILALDYGPGIADLSQAEEDGYSTANTFGKGLGAIRRLSDEAYIYTQQESGDKVRKWSGTVFMARFYADGKKKRMPDIRLGLFSRSLSDTRYNGDRIYLKKTGKHLCWLHLDGLGHGEEAQGSTDNLAAHLSHSEAEAILDGVDQQLVRTRGAVGVVCEVDIGLRSMRLLGVGDMHAHLYDGEQMQPVFFAPGILGREHRTTSPFSAVLGKRSVVVTASDGIRRNWDVGSFSGLFNQHPQLIAYTLGNIMGRISDDQSICVLTVG